MELLLDTDFIIKMARYSLLDAFDELAKAKNHAMLPFRYLYEIKDKMRRAKSDPAESVFGSHVALSSCQSFVARGLEMAPVQDYDVFNDLREIEGMDQGESILVEYMLRETNALMLSGDKKMINGLNTQDGDNFRPLLQNRIVYLNRLILTLALGAGWDEVRRRVCENASCDAALYTALEPTLSKPDAEAKLYKMTVEYERSSRGLLRASL